MALGLLAALAAAVLFGCAAVLQAVAARRVPDSHGIDPRLLLALLREPVFVAVLALSLAGFGFHLAALRLLPLFLAQAGIAASLAVTALVAVRFLGERLGRTGGPAVAAVCAGLALLAAAAEDPGDQRGGTLLLAALYVGIAAIVGGGALAARWRGPTSTGLLSLLAGLGFAEVGIAARVLPGLAPSELVTSPAAYALVVAGVLAFLVYSVALQRGSVTVATAPMIVAQTAVPAAVGAWLLGDSVREGWLVPASLGLVLTGAGAIALSRYEQAR